MARVSGLPKSQEAVDYPRGHPSVEYFAVAPRVQTYADDDALSGLFGCCAPLVRTLSLAVAPPTLLLSPAAAQARFAGLVVRHGNRDIFLVSLDNTFRGYYYAGFLLPCLEPCSERTRTFRAGKRRRPSLLENQNRPRLRRLWLEITGLFPSSCLFCAIGLRPIKGENLGVYRRRGQRR